MPESVSSLSTQLANIDAAIAAAEAGQSYSIAGRTITRASLPELYKRRDQVRGRLETAQATAAGRSRMFARTRVTGVGNL